MDITRLDVNEMIAYLVENSTEWIRSQRAHHLALSKALPDTTRAALRGYFTDETLDRARFRYVDEIENPGFYKEFDRVGEPIPLDFSSWAGITFDEVILVNESLVPSPPPHSVVFHEMVHVVQYEVLGIEEFSRRYVQRFVQARNQYMNIPLETQAFEYQERFERSDGEIFDAERMIRSTLGLAEVEGTGS